jgi:hypothetical protein
MVELLWIPGEGRCLRRVKRWPIVHRPGFSSWLSQPKPLPEKVSNVAEAVELRSSQEILAEIAALDADSAHVLAWIGGLL